MVNLDQEKDVKVALINPNTSSTTTQMMVEIAHAHAPLVQFQGITAQAGPPMIQDAAALRASAAQVVAMAHHLEGFDGVIVSAFGDPGVEELQAVVSVPVVGIGGAAMRRASEIGTPFAVATTTPKLAAQIDALAHDAGGALPYLGCFVTPQDAHHVMANAPALDRALLAQIIRAEAAGAAQVIIGGGPLGQAADRLSTQSPVPLINPIRAAVSDILECLDMRAGHAV